MSEARVEDFSDEAMAEKPLYYPSAEADLLHLEWLEVGGADVVVISFNRSEQRNPIDRYTLHALRTLVEQLSEPGGPRAIVLTGKGKTFSAGGDLKGYQSLYRDPDAFRQFIDDFDATCELLETSPAVVVAMVNGTCVAGGTELALACDLIVMADDARIGDGHLGYAQLPGAGGSQRLVRAIGVQRARQWLLTGQLYPAQTAVDIGLATLAVPKASLREQTLELIEAIMARTPLGIARMKQLIRIAQNHHLDDGLAHESDLVHDYAINSFDATEGLAAFAERRAPRYQGR
jgi:enoyl-CoA hydratase/carnithine racemase